MKITTAKTEIMCMSRQLVQCFLQTNGIILQKMKKFKNFKVTFTSDGRQGNESDTLIRKASAVMRQLYRSVVLKQKLCTKAKFSVFRSVFVPVLTYGHEC